MVSPELNTRPSSFDVDPSQGLSLAQVEMQRKQKLVNKTKKVVSKSYGRIFFDNFANPFNVLLIVITCLMIWGRLSFTNFLFAFILALNIGIGIYQDIHARILVERLKVLSDDKSTVLRDGAEVAIPKAEIVLADILILKAGDQVPADAVVRLGHCSCDESLLTGESVAALKKPGDDLFSGSFIKSGTVSAEVTHVGKDSYAEKLQSTASKFSRPKSEIAQSVWDLTAICTLIALGFGVVYVITAFGKGDIRWDDFFPMKQEGTSFIGSLSGTMVAMLPTGMFLLTSVALTTGVIHLARKNVLVQELYCIEMLARIDTICFDKTGTLTDGKMSVGEVIPFNGHEEAEIGSAVSLILAATGDENATAKALRERFASVEAGKASCCVPFDSEKKYSAATSEEGVSYAFGAYGFVPAKKDPAVELLIDSYRKKGYRCLVVGVSKNVIENGVLPRNFEICGVLVLHDHVKDDAKANIEWFQNSGVTIFVISGDDALTVSEIASKCGVEGARDYVDMSTVQDEDIDSLVETKRIFGRVLPEQKKKLVLALQAKGHKVAMTGDGVNDILALRAADCSIAMASGAAAAKNAAHLICTKSDFSSLPDVVAQGRRVINNLQRSCSLFLSKTVFAFLVSTGFLISLICGGPRYPFTTSHLLVWEIITIGLASFFLALQPSSELVEGSMLKNIFARAIPSGVAEATCAGVPFIFFGLFPRLISYDSSLAYTDAVSMAVLAFTYFSFITLYRTCRPLNRYRTIVFGASVGLSVLVLITDFFWRDSAGKGVLLRFSWQGLNWTFPLLLFGVVLIALGIYVLLIYLVEIRPQKRRAQQ